MEQHVETDRVLLVPPSMDLVDEVCNAIIESQNELSEFLPWVKGAIAEPEQNMKDAIANFESFSDELRYFISDKESKNIVGAIGLIIRDKEVPFFEIGYWIKTSETGKGFISEALSALENHAFSNLKARRIEIRAAETNLKSRSVAERAGYKLDGTFHNDKCLPSGELSNTVVYSKCQ